AALFSAVVTAFLIESYRFMQPDYTELTYRALTGTLSPKQGATASSSVRAVNCIWVVSLVTSLFTSLVAILAKQWLVAYDLPAR
ncbi:hypothetical protein EXIGLDRAFT_598377, partial [Exidia glandulosa HHB12029]